MKQFAPKAKSDATARTDTFRLSDHVGTTLAITVSEIIEIETKYGAKDAARVDVTIVDGLFAGLDHSDVLLFNAAVVDALREDVASEPVVAKVVEATSKSGNDYITLAVPSPEAYAAAEALFVKHADRAAANAAAAADAGF